MSKNRLWVHFVLRRWQIWNLVWKLPTRWGCSGGLETSNIPLSSQVNWRGSPESTKLTFKKTKFHKKLKLVHNFAGKVTLTVVALIGKKEIGFSSVRLPFMFGSSRPPDLTLLLAFDIRLFFYFFHIFRWQCLIPPITHSPCMKMSSSLQDIPPLHEHI